MLLKFDFVNNFLILPRYAEARSCAVEEPLLTSICYSCMGGVFYHLREYETAAEHFGASLLIRERELGTWNMDTALLVR